MTEFATSVPSRPYSCISIRRPGLISAESAIKYADYFENSTLATDAHRHFCLELGKQFPDYSDDLWGISASDSQKGYVIWGGPPMMGPIDGTVVPSASAGSLPFMPQPVMRVLRNIKDRYGQAWGRYGFVNAFNPLKNWYDSDTIGIDVGISMLMAENVRTGFVWNTFMKNQEAQRGMDRAGFKKYQPSGTSPVFSLLQFDHCQSVTPAESILNSPFSMRSTSGAGSSAARRSSTNLLLRGITRASHLFVDSVNVSMLSIHPRHIGMACIRIFKSHGNRFWRCRLAPGGA